MKLLINDLHVYSAELSDIGSQWARMSQAEMFDTEDRMDFKQEPTFFETFRSCEENRFKAEVFYTPEHQELETEYIKNDILDQLDYIHPTESSLSRSPQARQAAFEHFTTLVADATTLTELGSVGSQAYKAIQASKITIQTKDGEIEVPVIFPKGHLTIFWKFYNSRKAEFSEAAKSKLQELETTCHSLGSAAELRFFKKEVYSADIAFSEKKALWALADKRISQVA